MPGHFGRKTGVPLLDRFLWKPLCGYGDNRRQRKSTNGFLIEVAAVPRVFNIGFGAVSLHCAGYGPFVGNCQKLQTPGGVPKTFRRRPRGSGEQGSGVAAEKRELVNFAGWETLVVHSRVRKAQVRRMLETLDQGHILNGHIHSAPFLHSPQVYPNSPGVHVSSPQTFSVTPEIEHSDESSTYAHDIARGVIMYL